MTGSMPPRTNSNWRWTLSPTTDSSTANVKNPGRGRVGGHFGSAAPAACDDVAN